MESLSNIVKTIIIQDNIEHLWFIISNPAFLSVINQSLFSISTLSGIKPINEALLHLGIECKGKQYNCHIELNDIAPYTKALKCKSTPMLIDQKETVARTDSYDITLYLFQITDNDSTLIQITISKISSEQLEEVTTTLDIAINNIKAYLFNLNHSVYQNESIVLRVSIIDAWKYILNWENERLHLPNRGELVFICGSSIFDQESTFAILSNDKQNKFTYKVKQVNQNSNNNKWEYIIEEEAKSNNTNGTNTISNTNSEIRWTFIIINANQCYISFCHKFNQPINPQSMTVLSKDKKQYLAKIREIVEQNCKQ